MPILISLENLEELQDKWAASCQDGESNTPQPALNSPRSLESCGRAGIDHTVDIAKSTLHGTLLEMLQSQGPEGTELPLYHRDVGSIVTAERARVLQLYPFSLRNVGSDDDKLRAYEKFQQREGRRISTIRMLREIRNQLIAAEAFKLRKAHESAVAKTIANSPPKPKTNANGRAQHAATPPLRGQQAANRESSSSPGRQSDGDSEISLSTVSTATAQAHLTKRTIHAHDAANGNSKKRQGGRHILQATKTLTERSKSGSDARGFVSTDGGAIDSDDDDDVFMHHARAASPPDRNGVEFVHYVSTGPDAEAAERRTAASMAALDATKRQQKKKEAERLAAIERERKQRLIEDEERAFIRKQILRDRDAHRKIQTPQPPQWAGTIATTPPAMERSLTLGDASMTNSVKIHGAFDADASTTERRPPSVDGAAAMGASARSEDPDAGTSGNPSVPSVTLIPPIPPPSVRSAPSSPLLTPRINTPRDAGIQPSSAMSIQATKERGKGSSATDSDTQERHRDAVDPHELSAIRRREVIEAATAFRAQSTASSPNHADELPSPLVSPSRGGIFYSNSTQSSPRGGEFDFSNRADRARVVEARRNNGDYGLSVTEKILRDRDSQKDERWRAVERAKRAQDLLLSGRSTYNDKAAHGGTMFL